MSKHTPGPWDAIKSQPAEGYNCWWLMAGSIGLGTISGYQGDTEREANARLIAAAPDLLEALRMLRSQYVLFVGPDDDIATAVLAEVDAAIAKAEGSDNAAR